MCIRDSNYAKFKPRSIPGKSENPKFKGELCLGFQTTVSDRLKYRSVNTAIESIYINFALNPDNLRFKKDRMGKLFGNNNLFKLVTGKLLNENKKKIRVPSGLIKIMEKDSEKFVSSSTPYHLYD